MINTIQLVGTSCGILILAIYQPSSLILLLAIILGMWWWKQQEDNQKENAVEISKSSSLFDEPEAKFVDTIDFHSTEPSSLSSDEATELSVTSFQESAEELKTIRADFKQGQRPSSTESTKSSSSSFSLYNSVSYLGTGGFQYEWPGKWDSCAADVINIRGSNYLKDRIKVKSADALYEVIGCDLVRPDFSLKSIISKVKISYEQAPEVDPEWGVPRILIIHGLIPYEIGPMFGFSGHPEYDYGCNHIIYCKLSQNSRHMFTSGNISPAMKLWQKACAMRPAQLDSKELSLKAIGQVTNLESVPDIVKRFNGKPALITKSCNVHYDTDRMEFAFDIRQWAYLSRSGLSSLKSFFPKLDIEYAFLMESKEQIYLPEQLLACLKLSSLDPVTAKPLSKEEYDKL